MVCRSARRKWTGGASRCGRDLRQDVHVFPAIKAGALSYLLKDLGPQELAEALRAGARGEATLHPSVATRVMQKARGARQEVPNPFVELTGREMEVMHLLAEGLSNAQIAQRLVLSEKTVKGLREQHPEQAPRGRPHPGRRFRLEGRHAAPGLNRGKTRYSRTVHGEECRPARLLEPSCCERTGAPELAPAA